MNLTYIPQDTLKSNQTVIVFFAAIEMGTYLLIFVVLVVLFLLLLFFQPNQRVLKTVLENIPRRLQPSFKKKNRKKENGGPVGCCSFALESIQNHFFWDEINRVGDSMDATLLFLFAGISVCSWGSSLESAADSLPPCLDYTPVAVHLLFARRLNGSCFPFMGIGGTAKLFWGMIS